MRRNNEFSITIKNVKCIFGGVLVVLVYVFREVVGGDGVPVTKLKF